MEDTGNIVFAIVALAVALTTDYLYTHQVIWVSSAIPIFIFQLIIIGDKKLKARRGKGIIASLIDWVSKEENGQNNN